jgi:hypothetical protein
MAKRQVARTTRWILAVTLAGVLSAGLLAVRPAAASELEKLDTSLKLIPADAAFYSSMLRNRQQVEAILHSRAWARLMKMPVVQMGLAMYEAQSQKPGSPAAQVRAVLENPQYRKAIDLVADMFSHDVFVYGDQSVVGFVDLLQQIVGTMRYGPMMMELTGRSRQYTPQQIQGMLLFSVLAENADLIKTPDLVIGFKVKNKESAVEHLQLLEGTLSALIETNVQLKGRFKKTKVAGHEYLTLTLDGSMVPWDEVPIGELRGMEAQAGDVDKVMARLKKLTVVISLGLRDDYLLLAVGSSTDCLARLGKGKLLASRDELKPLEKFAGKELTSISYVSRALVAKVSTGKKDIDDLLALVNEMLPVAGLPEDMEKRIRKDAAALAADLKRAIPKPGAMMGFTFLTAGGMEGYTYDWGGHPGLDGSKPLSLLEHVGGSPILALVGRTKTSPKDYDLLVKWVKIAYGYFEDVVKPRLSDRERKEFETFIAKAIPLVKRMDKANRELLIPALADGQVGLVLDAKLTSRQFQAAMPRTEKPMPMAEPALLFGVSDAAALVKAMAEYREIANGLIDLFREISQGSIPPFEIPPPHSEKIKQGTLYYYPLPEELGLDKKILPNAGLSEKVAVIAVSREHTERLLASTPLKVGGVLAGAEKRPLATAGALDWAALVDAASPWVDLAATMIIKQELRDAKEEQAKSIMSQVHTVLDVLKCLKTVTSESYFEKGALVSHTLTEVQDLK